MYTTSVRELREDPALALQHAKQGPVVVVKDDQPDALLVDFESLDDLAAGVCEALAAGLYRDRCVSLGKAVEVSGLSMSALLEHIGSLGIEVAQLDETTAGETQDVSTWSMARPWRSPAVAGQLHV